MTASQMAFPTFILPFKNRSQFVFDKIHFFKDEFRMENWNSAATRSKGAKTNPRDEVFFFFRREFLIWGIEGKVLKFHMLL